MPFIVTRRYKGGKIEYLAECFRWNWFWVSDKKDAFLFPHRSIAERVLNDRDYGGYEMKVEKAE